MNTKVNVQTILIVFMVCVTVIVTANSSAKAQVGGENNSLLGNATESEIMVDPVPGGPGFIMVSVFDFKPYFSDYEITHTGSSLYNASTTQQLILNAGITLPHGATITKVTLYFLDNVSSNLTLYLAWANGDGYGITMTTLLSAGAQAGFRSVSKTTLSDNIVDNQNYSYFLQLVLPPNASTELRVSNVRIDYEYTVYTPTIMK